MAQPSEHSLTVGASAKVRSMFAGRIDVVYAGMLHENLYSVVVKWTSGNNSLAYNLFLPKTQKEVEMPKGRIIVSSVTPLRLYFRYEP